MRARCESREKQRRGLKMCKTGATTRAGQRYQGAMEYEDDLLGVGDLGGGDWRETERPERDTTITGLSVVGRTRGGVGGGKGEISRFVAQISRFDERVEVCKICGDYSHSAHNCPYYPQYENYHYANYASQQPDFSGFMSHAQVPQHEGNQQFHQSLSLEDMIMQVMESVPECWKISNVIRKLDFSCPGSKELVADLDQHISSRPRKIDEAELCSTQPTFNLEEDASVDTLTNLEVKEDTQMEDYLIDTSEECEVFQIEPEIVIALNEGEDEMNIDVNSDKPEKPQIESEEDQLLVLVQPPTLPWTFGTPYKRVEVRERLQIFYTADTFVLDDPDTIDSFVLEVPDELLNLKEGVHVSLPNCVNASFVVDISKGDGIT
ncbi:hypothetical protein Syun_000811 [Stephania yunnanensis]|uniref:Uncharacterized protein n=1 Tax=Stephania yunnanensis TaxID=152371 RepID=A0AAP0QA96_9MAGN